MRSILLIFLISLTLFTVLQAQKYTPLSDYSCDTFSQLKTLGAYTNWYWSGQQCMLCMRNLCHKCGVTSADNCTACANQYSLYSPNSTVQQYCRPCGTSNQNVQSCCFYNIDKGPTFGYETNDLSMHQINCTDNLNQQLARSVAYGGFCYKLDNCKDQTNYGKCYQCEDGYYLTHDYLCSTCNPPEWDSKWEGNAIEDQNIDINTNIKAGSNQYCGRCISERECVFCQVYNDKTDPSLSRGSYLATNTMRETFDKNIGKNPSYCRPCNLGCTCSSNNNLCVACISDNYYKDPNKNICIPCNLQCQAQKTDIKTADGKSPINCCSKCQWDDYMQGPRCYACRDFATDTIQVVQYDDTLSNVNSQTNFYKLCYRCDEQSYQSVDSTGAKVTNSEFAYKNWPNRDASVIADGNFIINLFGKLAIKGVYGSEGCTRCTAQVLDGSYTSTVKDSQDKFIVNKFTTDSAYQLRYLTCSECQNGYEKVSYKSEYSYVYSQGSNADFPEITNISPTDKNLKYIMTEKIECRKCQRIFKYYDVLNKLVQTASDPQRFQMVRRCRATLSTDASYKYTVTQCGLAIKENLDDYDYIKSGLTDNQKTEELERGPYYPTLRPITNSGDAAVVYDAAIKEFFNPDTKSNFVNNPSSIPGLLSNFLVETPSTNAWGKVCVANRWQCKKIDKLTIYPMVTDADYDTMKCLECFENYVLTTKGHCKRCYQLESTELPVGCNKCIKHPDTAVENSDKLQCSDCINSQQDGLKETTQNYKYTVTTNNAVSTIACVACDKACFTCGLQASCELCVQGYGLFNKTGSTTTPPQRTCLKCEDDFCSQCDDNIKICKKCTVGYRVIALGELTNAIARCEKCDIGCLNCDGDRKVCKQCDKTLYYLHATTVCAPKRYGCVNWEMDGGRCTQCQYGFREEGGFCYRCFNPASGYYDCPQNCGMNSTVSNTQRTTTPTSRILQLLEEDEVQQEQNNGSLLKLFSSIIVLLLALLI